MLPGAVQSLDTPGTGVREVTRRGIVKRISAITIGRFLESGGFKTASGPLLVES